jgi:hypothetical protein
MRQAEVVPLDWWFAAAVAAMVIAGCGGGNNLPLIPVSGRVTFDGGPCPAEGSVTFMPVDVAPGLPRRPGIGKFKTDGRFVATSFREGDGLIPGHYAVSITCYQGLPDPDSRDPFGDINFVPGDYRPDDLVVDAGSGPIEVNYSVPPKKAAP